MDPLEALKRQIKPIASHGPTQDPIAAPLRKAQGIGPAPTQQPMVGASIASDLYNSGQMDKDTFINAQMDAFDPLGSTSAVSIYKDKAARMAGGEHLMQELRNQGIPALEKAGEWLQKYYPRTLAHATIPPEAKMMKAQGIEQTASAAAFPPKGRVVERIPIEFTQHAKARMTNTPEGEALARDLLTHETHHVGGALGNSRYSDLYNLSERLGGYDNNPFEVGAYNRGARAMEGEAGVYRGFPAPSAVEGLKDLVREKTAEFSQVAEPVLGGGSVPMTKGDRDLAFLKAIMRKRGWIE